MIGGKKVGKEDKRECKDEQASMDEEGTKSYIKYTLLLQLSDVNPYKNSLQLFAINQIKNRSKTGAGEIGPRKRRLSNFEP